MQLNEVLGKRWKAGGIPYFYDGTQLWICLVTSTDPAYGGPDPCIPKGGADRNETPQQCGVREVEEETRIPPHAYKRVFLVDDSTVAGLTSSYQMFVFGLECARKETVSANEECIPKWYTADQAIRVCRDIHKPYLRKLVSMIS